MPLRRLSAILFFILFIGFGGLIILQSTQPPGSIRLWNLGQDSVYVFENGEYQFVLTYPTPMGLHIQPIGRYTFTTNRAGTEIIWEGFGFELSPICHDERYRSSGEYFYLQRCDVHI